MFSDDVLMEQLVLKGRNALDLVHGLIAVHDTWKNIQALVIAEIVNIEITLARGDVSAMPKGFCDAAVAP